MADASTATYLYHALLIGIDAYADPAKVLQGCINDILAVETLLMDPPGVGIPTERIKVTRLAAPNVEIMLPQRTGIVMAVPSRANIIGVLKALAQIDTQPGDRVLIYYSGHGDQKQWHGGKGRWHAAIVTPDFDYVFDVELNILLNAIAARVRDPRTGHADVTVILDCCHSAGATRDVTYLDAGSKLRFADTGDDPVDAPDLSALPLTDARTRDVAGGQLLQALEPNYFVLAACQADERAGERAVDGKPHGVLSRAFMQTLRGRDAAGMAAARWADIWPDLLERVAIGVAAAPPLPLQHPSIIGRAERRVFGGSWEVQDVGYGVTKDEADNYTINAGTMLGITIAAELAVYGAKPALFPLLHDSEDIAARVGTLRVIKVGRSSCTAVAVDTPFALPAGARARLIKTGYQHRLRVGIAADDHLTARALIGLETVQAVDSAGGDVEVWVDYQPGSGWVIRNSVEPRIARVPDNETGALCAGLEAYSRYQRVLQLMDNCNDVELQGSLGVTLLDCSNADGIAEAPAQRVDVLIDQLVEAPKDRGTYTIPTGFEYAIKLDNTYRVPQAYGRPLDTLYVTVFNCAASGIVQPLGEISVRSGASAILWNSALGQGFEVEPSWEDRGSIDQLIVVATTRPDIQLHGLDTLQSIQEVVNSTLGTRDIRRKTPPVPALPLELWTAVRVPVIIGPKEMSAQPTVEEYMEDPPVLIPAGTTKDDLIARLNESNAPFGLIIEPDRIPIALVSRNGALPLTMLPAGAYLATLLADRDLQRAFDNGVPGAVVMHNNTLRGFFPAVALRKYKASLAGLAVRDTAGNAGDASLAGIPATAKLILTCLTCKHSDSYSSYCQGYTICKYPEPPDHVLLRKVS